MGVLRIVENAEGTVYNEADKKRFFAEDFTLIGDTLDEYEERIATLEGGGGAESDPVFTEWRDEAQEEATLDGMIRDYIFKAENGFFIPEDDIGQIRISLRSTAPERHVALDGGDARNFLYNALFFYFSDLFARGTGSAFTADAGTDEITAAAHGLSDGNIITLSNSGGALPAGLSSVQLYEVRDKTTDTFKVATTAGGLAKNITGAGTGTHTFWRTLAFPNFTGRVLVNQDAAQAEFDTVGEQGGTKTHTLTTNEIPAHNHQIKRERSATTGTETTRIARNNDTTSTIDTEVTTENSGGGLAHNNLQPYAVVKYYICYVKRTYYTSI